MSSGQLMVVLIVLIVSVTSLMKARYRALHGIVADEDGNEQVALPRADPAMQKELETLRERVRVLERIATDEREPRRIAEEIERLRDQ